MKELVRSRAELRLVAAFAALPFVAGAVMFLTSLASWYTGFYLFAGGKPNDPVQAAISLALGVTIIAIVVTVFAAIPTVAMLCRRGSVSLRSLLLAGGVLGNMPFAVIACVLTALHVATGRPSTVSAAWFGSRGAARCVLLGLICGIASATVFWLMAFRRPATPTVLDTSGNPTT